MKRNINGGFVETRASLVDVCVCVWPSVCRSFNNAAHNTQQ